MSSHEGLEERAVRWREQVRSRAVIVEPDWWLRMECGQVIELTASKPGEGEPGWSRLKGPVGP